MTHWCPNYAPLMPHFPPNTSPFRFNLIYFSIFLDHKPEKKSKSRECRRCGQHHSHHEPHLYDYVDEVDEDLMCQICLQVGRAIAGMRIQELFLGRILFWSPGQRKGMQIWRSLSAQFQCFFPSQWHFTPMFCQLFSSKNIK